MLRTIILILCLISLSSCGSGSSGSSTSTDNSNNSEVIQRAHEMVVYGATPAGIMAAITAYRLGLDVAIVNPVNHIGGMVTSGLGNSDLDTLSLYGGLAREFFTRIGQKYGSTQPIYRFESNVSRAVIAEMLGETTIAIYDERPVSVVHRQDSTITGFSTTDGSLFEGVYFVDASYEGDLMARAGVSYIVGREGRATYNESLAGVQQDSGDPRTQLNRHVNGYSESGEPLQGIHAIGLPPDGSGDTKVMAYNFRVCLTQNSGNLRPISLPEVYEAQNYELLFRYLEAHPELSLRNLMFIVELPNAKSDVNNFGPVSTNLIGGSWAYPEADYVSREALWHQHRLYQQGFFYSLLTNPRVPQHIRAEMATWGYCADEFTENDNWPPQLYVRVARRMVGTYVMTEHDLLRETNKHDGIAIGELPIESHHVQRIIDEQGAVKNEGHVLDRSVDEYEIPFRAILPHQHHVTNLLVPVALSASHIAYSSIRMEPVFMTLGQSAATAVALSHSTQVPLHVLDSEVLQDNLRAQGVVIDVS